MNIGSNSTLDQIWEFVNQNSYTNKCRFKAKYAPGIITCRCMKCKSYYRFAKNEHQYQLISANKVHQHDNENEDSDTGEPIEESVKLYINSLIIGIEAKDFTYKFIQERVLQRFEGHINENRIRYIFNKYFVPDWLNSWRKIPSYIEKLKEIGIESDIKFETGSDPPKIHYIYFEAPYSKQFVSSNCFPRILMMDGTYLKPVHTKGILLILSTVTPDHIALPLSGAIVDAETKEAYKFLLDKCKKMMMDIEDIEISIITDQHESILSSLKEMCPKWKYSPCSFHLIQKFKEAHAAFFILIKSVNTELYDARLKIFQSKYKSTYKAIKDYLPNVTRIQKAPFRYNYVTDSVLEGINGSLSGARKYEPIFLIEAFVKYCVKQWNKQVYELNIHDSLYINRVECILNEMRKNGLLVTTVEQNEKYHVMETEDGHDFQYIVSIIRNNQYSGIKEIKCTCKMMLETLHPCIHTIMVLKKFYIEIPECIMGKLHYREENKQIFQNIYIDLPDIMSIVPNKNIDPTTFVRKNQPGRPISSKRFRGTWEKVYKKKRKCTKCGNEGHNKSSKNCPLHPQHQRPIDDLVEEVLNARVNENGVITIDEELDDSETDSNDPASYENSDYNDEIIENEIIAIEKSIIEESLNHDATIPNSDRVRIDEISNGNSNLTERNIRNEIINTLNARKNRKKAQKVSVIRTRSSTMGMSSRTRSHTLY